MIKKSSLHSKRAIALVAAAVLSISAGTVSAQNLNNNIFGGSGAPTTLTVSNTLGSSSVTNQPFGPSFTGSLTVGTGALTTLSESITNGTYSITETSAVAVTANFSASKTFSDTLLAGQYYRFTLTTSNAAALNALSGFNIQLSAGGVTALDTSSGTGLLGLTNVLNLFGSSNTATFIFQTPGNLPATGVTATFTGAFPVAGLGGSVAFTGASVTVVPEPNTWAMFGVGLLGTVVVCFRRRTV